MWLKRPLGKSDSFPSPFSERLSGLRSTMLSNNQQGATAQLKEVMRRTRLTRMQLRYLEQGGYLGHVTRLYDRRVFSAHQIQLLELVSRLRDTGASIDEAASLASEIFGGERKVSQTRLEDLIAAVTVMTARGAILAQELTELRARRVRSQS